MIANSAQDMPIPAVLGRHSECQALESLVQRARTGRSAVLVIQGEAGIGKSALLEHLVGASAGCQVLRVAGIQPHAQFAFAGLDQLCAPLRATIRHLPAAQADALDTALGLRSGTPEQSLVASALLALLRDCAKERPVICVVDNAHWMDDASALALSFVARRLTNESVALVLATRRGANDRMWAEFPYLRVRGLSDSDASTLLRSAVIGPLDGRVRDRILSETRGNPSLLLELPQRLTPTELAFGSSPGGTTTVTSPMAEAVGWRLQSLPARSRLLVLVAAAEPLGDLALSWRAAERLGIHAGAAEPAEAAGLVEFRDPITFQNPIWRSIVYRSASFSDRHLVHCALADATNAELDPDRWAWHRAQASAGPDEDVAAALERSVGHSLMHGGFATAAILLERAAMLTPHTADRARRQLNAAHAMARAGMLEGAVSLAVLAERGPLSHLQRARGEALLAQLRFSCEQGDEVLRSVVGSLQRLEPLDPTLAVDGYIEAIAAALSTARTSAQAAIELAQAARNSRMPAYPGNEGVLLRAVAMQLTDGFTVAAPKLKQVLPAFDSAELTADESVRKLWLAAMVAAGLWDYTAWDRLTQQHLHAARKLGAMGALQLALDMRVYADLFAGELHSASARVKEIQAVTAVAEGRLPTGGTLALAAIRGHKGEAAPMIARALKDVGAGGVGAVRATAMWSEALLCNGLAQYAGALRAGRAAAEHPLGMGPPCWGLVESIEGAVRAGEPAAAAAGFERLSEMAAASGTEWAMGLAARSGALVAKGERAHTLFGEAIDRLERAGVRVEAARARLLYGELLRREGRRREARSHLRTAHDFLTAAGVDAFATRAQRELAATGERVRRRTGPQRHELTAQEMQIARLAAEGFSNPEIGAELFVSPRTVEWHMGRVLAKLGITTRRQLREVLPTERAPH